MYPMEKPIIVGVAPSFEPNRHWIYYDDGMVVARSRRSPESTGGQRQSLLSVAAPAASR
jgi:hypothetical protein